MINVELILIWVVYSFCHNPLPSNSSEVVKGLLYRCMRIYTILELKILPKKITDYLCINIISYTYLFHTAMHHLSQVIVLQRYTENIFKNGAKPLHNSVAYQTRLSAVFNSIHLSNFQKQVMLILQNE